MRAWTAVTMAGAVLLTGCSSADSNDNPAPTPRVVSEKAAASPDPSAEPTPVRSATLEAAPLVLESSIPEPSTAEPTWASSADAQIATYKTRELVESMWDSQGSDDLCAFFETVGPDKVDVALQDSWDTSFPDLAMDTATAEAMVIEKCAGAGVDLT